MKKLLVSMLVGAMLFAGCAGLQTVESDVCKDTSYYVTSLEGKTSEFCPEKEYPIVTNVREDHKEAGVTISFMWIDYAHNAIALQYDFEGEDAVCGIFFFDEADMNIAISENYRDVRPIQAMGVECEQLISVAVEQANRDKE